jgi:hypothetical protein
MMAFVGWLTLAIAQGVLCFAAMHAYRTSLDDCREPQYRLVWLKRPRIGGAR